tara:strand:- start:58 stop:1275 length:1218 start_codon:yes stop_codon:yes gene_type:complete
MKDIIELKDNFEKMKILRQDISNIFENLEAKILILKKIYSDLVSTHSNNFIFGLDSFHFQNKLIHADFKHLKNIFQMIDNRLYCEYYKLHNTIQDYIKKDIPNEIVLEKTISKKKFPAYKSLDTLKVYDFKLVLELQSNITNSIMELDNYRLSRETELKNNAAQSNMGLNIDNLVHSYHYDNTLINAKIHMYIKYLHVFHDHHTKYFTRLFLKTKLMLGIINEDIHIKQFNESSNNTNIENSLRNIVNVSNKEVSHSPQTIIEAEEQENIKNLLDYDNVCPLTQNAFNNIMSNIPSSSSDNGDMSPVSIPEKLPVLPQCIENEVSVPLDKINLQINENKDNIEDRVFSTTEMENMIGTELGNIVSIMEDNNEYENNVDDIPNITPTPASTPRSSSPKSFINEPVD